MPPRSASACSQGMYRWSDEISCDSSEELRVPRTKSKGSRPLTKSVCFADNNEVFPIPHLDDLTDKEIAEIWYESSEYSEIKSSYQLTIFMMESGELVESKDHTARGLEYRTQQGAWARYENKRDAYNAVLDEQDRQWKEDKDDFEAIGRIYLKHSSKCAAAAAKRAAEDAKVAKEICQDLLKKRKDRRKKSRAGSSTRSNSSKASAATPSVGNVRQLLREQSFSRRGQIRDDIQKQKVKALTRAASNRALQTQASIHALSKQNSIRALNRVAGSNGPLSSKPHEVVAV